MDTKTFSKFIQITQYCGTCFANPLNLFLIYLILTKSPKKVGNYKYLMIYVSAFEIFFSIVSYVTQPFLHSFTSRVIVIMNVKNSIFNNHQFCFILDCFMCGMYGSSMTVFSIHFLYRYASLHTIARKLFEGYKLLFWMAIPQIYGFIWIVNYYFLFGMSDSFTDFIRGPLLTDLDINVDDVVYVGPYYFPEDKYGIHEMEWSSFWGMNVVWVLIGSSALTGFICGYLCYSKITKELSGSSNSQYTKEVQRQLFNALVMQSAIPFILMYLPSTVVLFCTFVQVNIGNGSAFISYSIALYPAVDPLPTLLIVKNYRNATKGILKNIWKRFTRLRSKPSQSNTSVQMRTFRIS